jgi:hypothetical protein
MAELKAGAPNKLELRLNASPIFGVRDHDRALFKRVFRLHCWSSSWVVGPSQDDFTPFNHAMGLY